MYKKLLSITALVIIFNSCASSSRNSDKNNSTIIENGMLVDLPAESKPISLTDLPRTEEGGFVLAPGYYEAEFKTYCLQPGTPDPTPLDAYLQAPVSGFRKAMVQTVLLNSRSKPFINQRNVQLLLWSIVSRSDFTKLPSVVKKDASELLTSKQIFELKGGVMGTVKHVSNSIPNGILKGSNNIKRLFEMGSSSYEMFEKIAVLREPSKIRRADFKNDQWYKQKENYYVRHFPVSYQKVRIQVYIPGNILDSAGKTGGEYLIFDPAGYQTVPANSNSQRLGIGGPVIDVIRSVIKINKPSIPPKKLPGKNKGSETPSKS
jgi:hypothetical protein